MTTMKKQSNNQSADYMDSFRKSAIRNLRSAIRQSGFSLMELMIAMGILVFGLAMVATAFPTAMLETKLSVADTMATMISENAAAICRVKLKHSGINGSAGAALTDHTAQINNPTGEGDLTYPVNTPGSLYGWLVAVRQPIDNVNDYQLVIVPYRKFLPGDPTPIFSPVFTNGSVITSGNKIIGSPVISTLDGTFAYVVDSETGELSSKITPGLAWAVVGAVAGQNSPAIGCYVVRTAVAP